MLFPAIELEGHPLWGFTYRLITDWLQLGPPPPVEQAGFQASDLVLEFLLENGLTLRQAWRDGLEIANVAEVCGAIPVSAAIQHFSVPGCDYPAVNCLDVRRESVRIIGPAFEEYLIRSRRC